MTELLATKVTVQQFTIIQNAHEKCLADGQPNNTIIIHTGSSSMWKETLEKTWQRQRGKWRCLKKLMISKYFLIPGGPHQVKYYNPTAALNSGSDIGRKVWKTTGLFLFCFVFLIGKFSTLNKTIRRGICVCGMLTACCKTSHDWGTVWVQVNGVVF